MFVTFLTGLSWLAAGTAEVERAHQAARQAELLASEAKKGEVEEKHKTSVVPACLNSCLDSYLMVSTCFKQVCWYSNMVAGW